jgi:mRNA interferase MazF
LKRGDVVLVVLRGALGKPRPAIVVQADELGSDTTKVLVCPMSSELSDALLTRPVVAPDVKNGLRRASQIMTAKLSAIPRQRIREVLGSLDQEAMHKLDRALLIVLGLAR